MNLFENYKKGDIVSFATYCGDLVSEVRMLRGTVVESDETHISVTAKGNNQFPEENGITYYIDEDLYMCVSHCGMDDNEKVRQYILEHWNEYDLTDTKEAFISLINILESHNENIDALHSAVFNGYGICGYLGPFENDRDCVQALLKDHNFYDNWNDIYHIICENAADDNCDEFEEVKYLSIQVTTDGFVINHQC